MQPSTITTTTTIVDNILNYWLDLREDDTVTPEKRMELVSQRVLAQPPHIQDEVLWQMTRLRLTMTGNKH